MIGLRAGGLPWLVWQDIRLNVRNMSFGTGKRWPLLIYIGFIALMHAGAGVLLWGIFRQPKLIPPEKAIQLTGVLLLSLEFFMLMAAMLGTFRLILAGRELTLHLSSPLPFARVLWMRVLALVAGTWAVSILLVTPVANMGAILGKPLFLLAYPVTVMMAMATVAFALTAMGLAVRSFGIVRARRVLQVVQAGVPLIFVLSSLIGRDDGAARPVGVNGGGLEDHAWLLRVPALAAGGDWAAMATLALGAVLALILAARFAAPAVLLAVQSPDAIPMQQKARAGDLRYRTGLFRVMLLKEWRTILRDARLSIALLAQPVLIIMFFYSNLFRGEQKLAASVAATTFCAAQICQYIANLMISAEEAPSLLGASPQPRGRVIAFKCIAALLPVLMVMLLASASVALEDPWIGFVCLVCSFGAGFCACAVEVARPYPAPRRSFVKVGSGRTKRDPLDIVSVIAMQLGWTAAAWFLATGSHWGAAIVLLVMLVPFFEWWRDANRQALLGY